MTETYDIVVVGAGWFGLAAAKAIHQIQPSASLAILESAESCGGTWSKNRLYPGLKSNNMKGTYEYPDFPMDEKTYGVGPNSHIPGATLHRYLTDFAKNFDIYDKVQFHTGVSLVERNENAGWRLTATTPAGNKFINTTRLVLATGLTSQPNMPSYKNAEAFNAPLFHAKDFCKEAPNLKVKKAIVVGGAKSAFDVAYALVHDGAEVDLIVRPTGNGPVWIAPPFVTPLKKRLDQLLNIRWMTWFSPCPWGEADGYPGVRNFLHGTAFGRFVVNGFWKALSGDVISANGYDSHPELKKLKPWHSAFWIGSGLSILNYDTPLFELVKQGKIRVHIDDIESLESKRAILASGKVLDTDAIICSTGWKKESTIKFAEDKLGLPYSLDKKRELNQAADAEVLSLYPGLKSQPELNVKPKEGDPLRYYRFIVPSQMVKTRDLAFAGMISTVSTATCATIQGHWIAAFFAGEIHSIPSSDKAITDEIMLHTQWGKWRYPCGYGADLPDLVFEGLPYCNMLMKDMGLETHRKGGRFAELTSPYLPADFRGLVEEWMEKEERWGKIQGVEVQQVGHNKKD
ncbi:FAD-containing monooxygenase [Fusarium longipes]|uniref:FAD-containing monooxygenase n=1 Tax=Fusarium longipes TaxID=694270 RepID=A0A395RML8_9HYPO|nr:FAD-containing monooxygenase [Fusarium longipes]